MVMLFTSEKINVKLTKYPPQLNSGAEYLLSVEHTPENPSILENEISFPLKQSELKNLRDKIDTLMESKSSWGHGKAYQDFLKEDSK